MVRRPPHLFLQFDFLALYLISNVLPKECFCCGASGEDAFTDIRSEVLDEIDDDYFDYEKPLDFVTAAERRKLMKQAGGDEEKANAMLTQGDSSSMGKKEGDAPKKKKKATQ